MEEKEKVASAVTKLCKTVGNCLIATTAFIGLNCLMNSCLEIKRDKRQEERLELKRKEVNNKEN